jgi:HK97 family phage major capsid protein
MSERLRALLQKRHEAVTAMRALTDTAGKEKRDLSADELAKHTELFNEAQGFKDQITAEERSIALAREAADAPEERGTQTGADELQRAGFRGWLASGTNYAGEGAQEFRDLQVGIDTQGGFLVAPQTFVKEIIRTVANLSFIRNRARVIPVTSGDTLGAVTREAAASDAEWTRELGEPTPDTALKFGKRELKPDTLSKMILVSRRLLRVSALDAEQLIRDEFAELYAITEEKGFLTGTGVAMPLGVFTAHADGVPTSRDVSTGNTSTAITFDGLKSAQFALKAQHRRAASWLFHRDAVSMVAKLKDLENQYLWEPSNKIGEPDVLLGHPVDESEYVPNTFTSGLYVGLLANWKAGYWIAEGQAMDMQRLNELYAKTNQVGFIARKEIDGQPVLSEAFARVKLG